MRRRKLSEFLEYREPRNGLSEYARQMREWPGFETDEGTNGHLVRLTPRDFPIFAAMDHGADYPQARKLAEHMLEEELQARRLRGESYKRRAYHALRGKMVPPYDPDKFPNKWWKLVPTKPSRTLTAHMGKDTYSHIHYDSRQCRTVSVREAARLQSFPDGFCFAGAMNSAFRQIGNAVPPLLCLAVARVLKSQLDNAASVAGEAHNQQAA
jgi:DNA (cytosine-5)-methyltransferase 1